MSTKPSDGNALTLTEADVQRLLTDSSAGVRIDMTSRIGGAYNETNLNPRDALVAEQVFRLLLRDTELRVRVALAGYVKDSTQIPGDIVMAMARDVEEVSLPVLQFSQVLTDQDLMELIQSTDQVSRYLAISRRPIISEMITGKLIEKGNNEVTATLVENQGAQISEAGYERIIQTHYTNETMMQSLSARPHLPLTAVDKMMTVVSASLSEKLKAKYKLPGEQIDREVEKAQEKETLHLVRLASGDDEVDKLVNQLHGFGRLTPSIILSALCQGNFDFFEMGIAKLANVPVSNTRKLIRDRGELGFRGLYNKSGLSDTMFPAVKLLLRTMYELHEEGEKPGTARYPNRVVERLLQHADETPVENLSYIIALVRKSA